MVASPKPIKLHGQDAFTTVDKSPVLNAIQFGLCLVTQKPCVGCISPVEWTGTKSDVHIGGNPALQAGSRLPCALGGTINLLSTGPPRSLPIAFDVTPRSMATAGGVGAPAAPSGAAAPVESYVRHVAPVGNTIGERAPVEEEEEEEVVQAIENKILFVNGHYQDNWVGRRILGSSKGGRQYWSTAFENAAKAFFGDPRSLLEANFIDGSSMIGFDMSGGDRYRAGVAFVSNNMEELTGEVEDGDAFKIITHSEGAAYGAGVARKLIDEGFTVSKVVHLSADEGDEFTTPSEPQTIQIGYYGDRVTRNFEIEGVNKSGLVNSGLSWKQVHGYTRGARIFPQLEDLISVRINRNSELRSDGSIRSYRYQRRGTTPNGTDFTHINNHLLWHEDGSYKRK